LGDQLIRNESIALLELVKNSYDADASRVDVSMTRLVEPDRGSIIVEDDGFGMDLETIRNVWMEPGSDRKSQVFQSRTVTPRFGRLPIGEKGIGRFGAHKLGNVIEMVTRRRGNKEIFLSIDWRVFSESKYLSEIPVEIIERRPEVFTGDSTGTRLVVRRLKQAWTRGMVRDIHRSLFSLTSPFDAPDSFKAVMKLDRDDWLEGLVTWKDLKRDALYDVRCTIEGAEITEFRYAFKPWPSMKGLEPREVTEDDRGITKLRRMVDNENTPVDLARHRIGRVEFRAMIFDRDARILNLGVQDKKGLKEYLNANGGVRVYRDGMRVYDYGEPDNDWLNLDIRRVNIPTKRISNNIILGAVHLSREASVDLEEKTNREGFVENEAYLTFVKAVLYALHLTETQRNSDKERLRVLYGPTKASEPVVASVNKLRAVVKEHVRDEKVRAEIERYLDRIETDYTQINEVLLRSAGAGLSLSVVIHEVEKVISELKMIVKKEKVDERIVVLVKRLADLVEGYSILVRAARRKTEDLAALVKQALFNIEYRLKAHQIRVTRAFEKYKGKTDIPCARNLVIGAIMNVIDNSIWWLEYSGRTSKELYVAIEESEPGHLSVVIADNGPGFSLPTEEIVKPFVSGKLDGMGLGLHIVKEVMEMQGGRLVFPERGDVELRATFRHGAVVELRLKKPPK